MLRNKNRVLLAMSGGIDSAVASILLKNKGYEVVGMTMRLWSLDDNEHNTVEPDYINDARKQAEKLHIEHVTIDVRDKFYDNVIKYFTKEYLAGRTPNPCARCNVVLKWKVLEETAMQLGIYNISTGHYVNKIKKGNNYYIAKGIDPDKEQSFFLWGLSSSTIEKALFPLGNLTKSEVRQIAIDNGFIKEHKKKESTGVCFLAGADYRKFLKAMPESEIFNINKGVFVDNNGNIVGHHLGYPFYTVGQRRGLGLSPEKPYYVIHIEPENNTVRLGHRDDLYKKEMLVQDYNIINRDDFRGEVITRIRYRKQSALSTIEFIDDNTIRVCFNSPEWSIAPGQTAAFYKGDKLLGGGFIK